MAGTDGRPLVVLTGPGLIHTLRLEVADDAQALVLDHGHTSIDLRDSNDPSP